MLIIASALMGIAVILGALGAHALQSVLTETQLRSFETGVRYQAWHALALLAVQIIPQEMIGHKARRAVSILFLLGIALFSFSIYLLNLRDVLGISGFAKILGPITPLGGLCFIAGWCVLAIALARRKSVI